MSTNKNQSAIREARDQLFLDTADGGRLTIVSDNLGVVRPAFGIQDDEWRAIVKNVALEFKQITRVFRKLIEICVGPKFNRATNLSENSLVGDQIISVNNPEKLVQKGTLVISKGQAGEEEVEFCYVDYVTGQVFLNSPLTNAHTTLADGSDFLLEDILVGSQSLTLYDSSNLPSTGFPYTISIGTGTLQEEAVTVTENNATSSNTTFSQVWSNDGAATFNDETANANSTANNDWAIFNTGGAADIAYFGFTQKFTKLIFDNANGVAGTVGTVTWEYWDGTSWTALSGVSDGTSGFTAAVADGQELTFDLPSDWAPVAVNASPLLYYVRADVGTAYTVAPVYDQGFVETIAGTITISATTQEHSGFKSAFVRKPLLKASVVGQTFLVFDISETRDFPSSGWIRIDANTASEEIVFFDENDIDDNVLFLDTTLSFAHAVNASVELLVPGAVVETANVLQEGIHWDIFDTDPKNLRIFIPDNLDLIKLLDASWLHTTIPTASTTLTANVLAGDSILPVTSVLGFTDEAGLLDINTGGETVFYTKKNSGRQIEISQNTEPFALSDGETLTVSVDGGGVQTATFNTGDFVSIAAATALEISAVINTDITGVFADVVGGSVRLTSDTAPSASSSIEVTGGTGNTAIGFLTPGFVLSRGLVSGYSTSDPVDLIRQVYSGTDLEDGNIRDLGGVVIENQFTGPYIFNNLVKSPTRVNLDLNEVIPPTAIIQSDQTVGWTNLEVDDASLFDPPPFTPYNIRVGVGTGFEEDISITDRTLAVETTTTTDSPLSPGATTVSVVASTGFPETTVTNKAGYRVVINKGLSNEEVVKVLDNNVGSNDLITEALTGTHASGSTVDLLNDTLTVNILQKDKLGPKFTPTSSEGHKVQKLIDKITLSAVAAGAGFPNSGEIYINFGKERVSTRSRINSIISDTVYQLDNTSNFPTTDFPYQVTLGQGRPNEEVINVSANDTGLNRLTFATTPINPHSFGTSAQATGSITTVAQANLVDGTDTFTIDDGIIPPVTFEFDKVPDGVAAGNVAVDISSDVTADDIRDSIITAITGSSLSVTATNGGAATVTLTHDKATHVGNIDVVENVADAGFIVSGMSGGSEGFGEYVEFVTGGPEIAAYQDLDGTDIEFIPPIVLDKHTIGETVMLAGNQSVPSVQGNDYPFYLPPDPLICLKVLIEEIKAYGVEVTIIDNR